MTILQAIILGIVQGLTEFIPVSSTAHLIFASRLTGLFASVEQALRAEQTTAAIAVIQLGTLLAVFVYFARDIWPSLLPLRDIVRCSVAANRRAHQSARGRVDDRRLPAKRLGGDHHGRSRSASSDFSSRSRSKAPSRKICGSSRRCSS